VLTASIGCLSAGSPKKPEADKYSVIESSSAELLPRKKQAGNKVTFRCRITRYNNDYTLLAKILKNDSAMHVMRPGIKFSLSDGDSVVLKAERPAACCSSWADGRWYNTSFKMNASDMEKLADADIISVTIPYNGGEISRSISTGKGNAIRKMLQSVGED